MINLKQKLFFILLISWGILGRCDVLAQRGNMLSSDRLPVVVSLGGIYERLEIDGLSLEETSVPFSISAPFSRFVSMRLRTGGGAANVDGNNALSGFTDAQLGLRYTRRFVDQSLSVDVTFNLPSGKKELSLEELGTAVYLSQPFYGFQIPGFGQGFNVTPSITWAFPMSDNMVMGLVASYGFKGPFSPVANMADDFDPGDELSFGAGLDVQLSTRSTLSGDASWAFYGRDEIADDEVFEAGSKLALNLMFRQISDFDELRIALRYVSREKGQVYGGSQTLLVQTLPNMAEARAYYRWRAARIVYIGFTTALQRFGVSSLYEEQTVGIARISPSFTLSDRLELVMQTAGIFGDFYGFDVGAGLHLRL